MLAHAGLQAHGAHFVGSAAGSSHGRPLPRRRRDTIAGPGGRPPPCARGAGGAAADPLDRRLRAWRRARSRSTRPGGKGTAARLPLALRHHRTPAGSGKGSRSAVLHRPRLSSPNRSGRHSSYRSDRRHGGRSDRSPPRPCRDSALLATVMVCAALSGPQGGRGPQRIGTPGREGADHDRGEKEGISASIEFLSFLLLTGSPASGGALRQATGGLCARCRHQERRENETDAGDPCRDDGVRPHHRDVSMRQERIHSVALIHSAGVNETRFSNGYMGLSPRSRCSVPMPLARFNLTLLKRQSRYGPKPSESERENDKISIPIQYALSTCCHIGKDMDGVIYLIEIT